MCGRFALIPTPEEVEDVFGLMDIEDFPRRYNIAPTQPIQMIVRSEPAAPGSNLPERRALLVRWGLIPGWAKNPQDLPLVFNARSESAAEKASFRAAMRHRRALVPASGFYEWRKKPGGKGQPFWVRPRNSGIVAFAGLMETWHEPGGSEIDTGAILTTHANQDLAPIHDRMPVVIHPQDFARWLDCRANEPRDIADLLRPADPGFFEAVPVSDAVNKVTNTSPENMQRVELPAGEERSPQKPKAAQENAASSQLKLF